MVKLAQNIGDSRGLYLPDEAAFYARIHPKTMRRWLEGSTQGERVFRPARDGDDQKFATFLDFVQALAIRTIRGRKDLNISLQRIRSAVNYAEEHGVTYPFARKHTTYWDGKEIHIKLDNKDFIQATGKHINQASLKQIVEVYMLDLKFSEATGLANNYRAFSWGGHDIEMDPEVRFGEPIVTSCQYTAQSLWDAANAEGGVEPAARAYGVKEREVECAVRYLDFLQPKLVG